jgi:hypothetical protein
MTSLEARIARLEKSALRWKLATFSLLLLAVAAVSLGQHITIGGGTGGMQAPVITADKLIANQSITLNDSTGTPRLVLSAAKDAPSLALKDADDHTLMLLALDKDAANILIQDAKGKKLFAAP